MVALLFNTVTLPASVGVALRPVSRGVAASVKSVRCAQTFHALRWLASETVIGVLSFPTTDAVAPETSDWRFSSARSGLPASAFGKCAKVSLSPVSFAPNKSFKPTPHRGGNNVLCATLHAVATPPWGGLTPALACMNSPSQPIPTTVKLLALLMTLVVSGIGVMAIATHYAPERSTRYGLIPALHGAQADAFGVTIFFAGLLPLGLLMGTARRAGWFGCIVGLLILASLLIGAR